VVAIAETVEFADEGEETFAIVEVDMGFATEALNHGGQNDGHGGGEAVGDGGLFGFLEEIGGGIHLAAEPETVFSMAQPGLETALAPFGEVLVADGAIAKMFREDGVDLGEAIEPGEDNGAGFAVVEALVKFVADGAG